MPREKTTTPEQMAEIKQALEAGRKIEAVKLYREWTETGLAEAKERIESLHGAMVAGETTSGKVDRAEPAEDRVLSEYRRSGLIAAIRYYRKASGCDLKASKKAVEQIIDRAVEAGGLEKRNLGTGSGCFGVWLILAAGILQFPFK